MKVVQHGHLKTSRKQYDPESGELKLSLNVPGKQWEPQTGLEEWNQDSRLFLEVKSYTFCFFVTSKVNSRSAFSDSQKI